MARFTIKTPTAIAWLVGMIAGPSIVGPGRANWTPVWIFAICVAFLALLFSLIKPRTQVEVFDLTSHLPSDSSHDDLAA